MLKSFVKFLIQSICLLLVLQSCKDQQTEPNRFLSNADSLLIKTNKKAGDGLFSMGAFALKFKDSFEYDSNSIIFPKNIYEIKQSRQSTNFRSEKARFIDIMSGIQGNKNIFIVDENNNKDFSDDPVRIQRKMNWFSTDDLIMVKFISKKNELKVLDSSWVKIGLVNDQLFFGRSEHVSANLYIDEKNFRIGAADAFAGDFTYGSSTKLALTSNDFVKKDSLLEEDLLTIGEYLQLGKTYYKFENISPNGENITLIKENLFLEKIGTQKGMLAPEFNAVNIQGELIKSSSMQDKIIVIANTCTCGGDKISAQCFYDIQETYGDQIYLLGLDSNIPSTTRGLFFDMENASNSDIYEKYRKMYCSRICYVIGTDNRIIDKFQIFNWKLNLSEILHPK